VAEDMTWIMDLYDITYQGGSTYIEYP